MRLSWRFYGGEHMASFHLAVVRTLIFQVVTLAFSTIVTILISRKLGVDNRGIVSWMIAYSGFGAMCAALGMGQAAKKYIAQMPHHASAFILVDLILLGISLLFFV